MMELTLLGTGCPKVDHKRFGPANLVSTSKTNILVDCGSGVTQRLEEIKVSSANIDALVLTHLHSDHVGLSTVLRNKGIKFGLYKNAPDFIPRYNDWTSRFKAIGEYAKKQGAPKEFLDDMNSITTPSTTGKITPPEILLDEGKIKNNRIWLK